MTQFCYPEIEVPDLDLEGVDTLDKSVKDKIKKYVELKYKRKFCN
jgi:hypothetical protein